MFTDHQHAQMRRFIGYCATFAFLLNLFTVVTFLIDWKSSNTYPGVLIFYLSACLFVATLGWIVQFVKSTNDIVCRNDNTLRYEEPSRPDAFLCLTTFIIIYYFSMAALIYFVLFSYSNYVRYTKCGTSRSSVATKSVAHYHLTAWSLPLIMTIFILIIGEVDGSSMYGICMVGFIKPVYRFVFIFLPLTIGVSIAVHYTIKTIRLLYKAKVVNDKTVTEKSALKSRHILWVLVRMTITGIFIGGGCLCLIVLYIRYISYHSHLMELLNDAIICGLFNMTPLPSYLADVDYSLYDPLVPLNQSYSPSTFGHALKAKSVFKCRYPAMPLASVVYLYVPLVFYFASSLVASLLIWTPSSFDSWRRVTAKWFNLDAINPKPAHIKRHEIVAKAYERRNQFAQGTYAPSFASAHNDPLAMDLNSAMSETLSNTFRDNLQALLTRRGAAQGAALLLPANRKTANNRYAMAATSASMAASALGYSSDQMSSVSRMDTSSVGGNSSLSDTSQQHYSFESQMSNEQLELTSMLRNRPKSKKDRKVMHRLLHHRSQKRYWSRRGSDSDSGSLISAAAFPANRILASAAGSSGQPPSNSKSTSTGDLNGAMQQAMLNQLQQQRNRPGSQMLASPYMVAAQHQPQAFSHLMSSLGANPMGLGKPKKVVPTVPKVSPYNGPYIPPASRIAMNKQHQNIFTFTHGMSDQSSKLVDPLSEKRRPDSSASMNGEGPSGTKSTEGTGSQHDVNTSPFNNTNLTTGNFQLNTMAANIADLSKAFVPPPPPLGSMCDPATAAIFQGVNPFLLQAMALQQLSMGNLAQLPHNSFIRPQRPYGPMAAPQQHQPLNRPHYLYNTNIAYCNHLQQLRANCSEEEMKRILQEQSNLEHLVKPMRSDSEAENMFPIQMSDSEGMFSDFGV